MVDRQEILKAFKQVKKLLQKEKGKIQFLPDALGFPVKTQTKGGMLGIGKETIIQLEDEKEFLKYVDIMAECGIDVEESIKTLCNISVWDDNKEHIFVKIKSMNKHVPDPHTKVDAIREIINHIATNESKKQAKELINAGLPFSEIIKFCTNKGYNTEFVGKKLDVLLQNAQFPAALAEYGDGLWRLIRDRSVIKNIDYYEDIFNEKHKSPEALLKAVVKQEIKMMAKHPHKTIVPNAIHSISSAAWSELLSQDNAGFSVLRDLCNYPKGKPAPYETNNIALATFVLTPTTKLSQQADVIQKWVDDLIKNKTEAIQQLDDKEKTSKQEEFENASAELDQAQSFNELLKTLIDNGQTQQFDEELKKLKNNKKATFTDKIAELEKLATARNNNILPQLEQLCAMTPEAYDKFVGINQKKLPSGYISRIGNGSPKTLINKTNQKLITFDYAKTTAQSIVDKKNSELPTTPTPAQADNNTEGKEETRTKHTERQRKKSTIEATL